MAKAKNNNNKINKITQAKLSDTQRWVIGVVLFIFAVFLLAAVIFYYFYWSNDQQAIDNSGVFGEEGVVMNPTGKTGAKLAHLIVGQWFGVFGLVIPIVLIILALRIINYRPAALRKSVRVSLIVAILGSLSFGFLFREKWGVFGTGLGGYHGIIISDWIRSFLGAIGTGLVLLLGWILTGVYINSKRTIAAVNKMGKGIFDGSVKVGEAVADKASEMVVSKERKHEVEEIEEIKEEAHKSEIDAEEAINPYFVASEMGKGKEPQQIVEDLGIEGEEARISAEKLVDEYGGAFEITDSRASAEEAYQSTEQPQRRVIEERGAFKVISTATAENPQMPDADSNVVMFGEDAGRYIVTADGERFVPDPTQYVGGVGRFSPNDNQEVSMESQFGTTHSVGGYGEQGSRGGFEVVDRGGTGVGAGESSVLSTGGVVEARSDEGIRVEDKMHVVVAGRADATLSDEEIDDSLYDPTKDLSKFQRPPVELLEDHTVKVQVTEEEIHENKDQIVNTLSNFNIKIDKIKATIGPTVTLYEIVPAPGIKVSRIKNLEDDIALSLKALGIRIIAPMPGQGTIGIEVPNKNKEIVSMYSVIKTKKFQESDFELPVALGKTISNETFVIDLAKMPHLLVAGATGQGKSVGLNVIITSLLYKRHPSELKFVMVDPKRVELSLYNRLEKHYLAKMESEDEAILTDTQKVVYTLNALCAEMSDRYDLLRMAEVKKISEYNEKFTQRRLNPNKGHRFLPYIVVVIDEFADMIMTAGREIETPITRLAQLARAVGIHLVIATQRPDVKVITGLIKANFPARIAYRVMSMVDSRTIIDQPGANQLIGRGDMLLSLNGVVTRIQCAFIDTPEIERVTEFIGNQRGYSEAYSLPDYSPDVEDTRSTDIMDNLDELFTEVANFVVQNQQGSTSSIQRRFSVGYNRAGRIMDQLEGAGIVGGADGSKPREVLISDINSLEYILSKLDI